MASINQRIRIVKVYAKLTTKAGVLDGGECVLIRAIEGYSHKESRRINERRETTRVSTKKREPVHITPQKARKLKTQPDALQGHRDQLLMCLLLDHGLRVSEVELLQVENFDQHAGTFTFFRPKVDREQTHALTDDTYQALRTYLAHIPRDKGQLLLGSVMGGALAGAMSKRAINKRVRTLGTHVGLVGLSPHDCRHFWATRAARNTPPNALMEAGGWSSVHMVMRYIEASKIANSGVNLE